VHGHCGIWHTVTTASATEDREFGGWATLPCQAASHTRASRFVHGQLDSTRKHRQTMPRDCRALTCQSPACPAMVGRWRWPLQVACPCRATIHRALEVPAASRCSSRASPAPCRALDHRSAAPDALIMHIVASRTGAGLSDAQPDRVGRRGARSQVRGHCTLGL